MLHVGAHKLEVDFIFDIRHHNERRDDAIALAGGESRGNLAIPHVVTAGEERADSVRSQGEKDSFIVVDKWRALRHPVRARRVAEILADIRDAVERCELVVGGHACWVRYAGCEIVGVDGVATAQAVRAYAALSVRYKIC